MSKAVLIMDMPKCCGDCVFSNPDGDYCPFLGEVTRSEYETCKKADCPLRELPERKPERILKTLGKTVKTTRFEHSDLNIGWNACIDAIEGSKANE